MNTSDPNHVQILHTHSRAGITPRASACRFYGEHRWY